VDHEEGEEAEAYRDDAFDYEDPCPAWAASSSVQVLDCGGEEAAKGAGEGGGGEEDCLGMEVSMFVK
jgi:hypothetical protein